MPPTTLEPREKVAMKTFSVQMDPRLIGRIKADARASNRTITEVAHAIVSGHYEALDHGSAAD